MGNRRWTKCAACHLRTNKVTIWPLNRSRGANPALPPPRYYSHPVPSSQPPSFLSSLLPPAVALTRTSAYITHKNLDVRKIMEAMRTAHAKKRDTGSTHLKQNMTQKIMEHTRACKRKARIACEEHFISLNRLINLVVKVLLKCSIRFSISIRWYAFPNFCAQISRPLACGVRTLLKS